MQICCFPYCVKFRRFSSAKNEPPTHDPPLDTLYELHVFRMGAYLRKPVTTKLSEDGYLSVGGEECQYTVTAMRGWRITMEVSNVFKSENNNYLCHDYVQKISIILYVYI